jgi:outer membrane protein OmpA-like peptidoglycan-associated protein
MGSRIKMIVVFLVCFSFSVSAAFSQQQVNYLDNMKIVAIKSMEIEHTQYDTFLNMVIEIHNRNNQRIKIYDGKFQFYLQLNGGEKKLLGTDLVKRDIILESANILEDAKADYAEFKINVTNNRAKAAEWIINTMGNPKKYEPLLYIDGEFKLGVESGKGWTNFPQIINWVFEPDIDRNVLLEGYPGPSPSGMLIIVEVLKNMRCYSEMPPVSECIPNEFKAFLRINFDFDSAQIRKDSYADIDEWGKALNHPDIINKKFIIAGHTCDLGKADYNQKLSEKRAKEVAAYLTKKHKIAPSRLKTTGFGEKCSGPNDTPERRAINRRVEFICIEE